VTGNSAVFNAAGGLPTLGLEEGPGTFNTWTGGTLGYGTANANIYTAKNSGEAAVAAGVSDGTNNHRAKLFVDNTNSVWGLYETFSLGNFPFVIARGNTELFRLTSVGVATIPDLKNTGSAGGKKVVCVDTATGTLYASSTGTDCSN
jgi:hypothetical protein